MNIIRFKNFEFQTKLNRQTGKPANRQTKKGQGTLEMTVALILVILLLVGAVKIFVWMNERMVYRQVDYESNRVEAGSAPFTTGIDVANFEQTRGLEVNESDYPALNIFG